MKRTASLALMFAMAACLALSSVAVAAQSNSGETSLAVYNDGRLLVREVRSMEIPKSGEMLFAGVPETIRPDTLSVTSLTAPGKFQLVETGYRYERIEAMSLLRHFIGKELTVILPDPADADARVTRKATLLSADQMPVFEIDGKIYLGMYDGIVFPNVPDGLDREPVLRWLVANKGPARQKLEVSYLADGMAWRADYAMTLSADQKSASISAWASMENGSGADYENASVKLVAGDVGRAPAGNGGMNRAYMAKAAAPMMEADMAAPEVRGVGEYHVYDLPRPVTLARGESRQVRLFSAPAVPVTTELVSSFSVGMHRYGAEKMSQPVSAYVKLKNREKGGLGVPMPAGTVRMYQKDTDGAALLMGEAGVSHTAPGSEVQLRLGSPFDVSVERKQTGFRETGKRSATMTWEITVRNGSDKKRTVKLQEQFHRGWKITDANTKYTKLSSGMAEFEVVLPAGKGETTIRYTVDLS